MTDHRDLDVAESGSMGFPTSDPELITRVRGGDRQAFAELYRRHVGAATNLARQIIRGAGADDLVSEAFARVLDGLLEGKGPDAAFRAYVFTTVRNTANDRFRRDKRVTFTDDQTAIDSAVSDPDIVMLQAENGMVGQAYQSLPERWQAVLWYLSVEGYSPAKTGELLGLSANAVTSLAFRAREGLREAYLQAHLLKTEAEQCSSVVGKLGAWTRDGLSRRERTTVDAHLDSCPDCRALASELGQINSGMRALLAPLLLGGAALAYLKLVGPATAIAKIGLIGVGTATGTGAAASTGAAGTGVAAGAAGTGGASGTATAGTTAAGTTAGGTAAAGTTAAGSTAAGTTAAGTTVGATAAGTTAVGTGVVGTGVAGTGLVGTGVIGTSAIGTGVIGTGVGVGAGVAAGGIVTGTGVGLVSAGGIGAGLVSVGGIGAGLAAVGITAGFGGLGTLIVALPKTVLAVAGSTIGGAAVVGAMLTGTPTQPAAVAAPAPVVVSSTVKAPPFPSTSDGTVVIRTSSTPTTGSPTQTTPALVPLPITTTTTPVVPIVPVPTETTTATMPVTENLPGTPVDPPTTETPVNPVEPTTPTETTSAALPTEPALPVDPPPVTTPETTLVPATEVSTTPTPTTATETTTTTETTTSTTETTTSTTETTVSTTETTTTSDPTTPPPPVLVPDPSFTGTADLTTDLGTGTLTLVQQISNTGNGALTDATLTADSAVLTPISIDVAITPSTGTNRAAAPAADCTAAGCALPTIPAGSTATVTLTLRAGNGVTLDQLRAGAVALQVSAGSQTATSSVELARSIPTLWVSSVDDPITAGRSGALDVTLTAAAGSALPNSVGVTVDDRLRLAGADCTTAPGSGSLRCPVTATDTGAVVRIAVAALPDARTTTAEITVGRFTTFRDIAVRPRTSQISLTGPFQVSSTGAALGRTCVGAAPAGANAPTACATDVPATATILWAEVVWTWATDPAPAESGVTLWSGADADNGTRLTLGAPSGVTAFGTETGDDAGYRSAPIVLDADAQAALTGGNGSRLGFGGPEGAVGGWTVVMLWTDDSLTVPATVQVDDSVQIVRTGESVASDAGTISSLFDLDAGLVNLSRWRYSWFDEQGILQNTLVQLITGARLFPGGAAGTFSTGAGGGAAHGLLYGPVITPR